MPQIGVFRVAVDIAKEKMKKIAKSGEKTLKKYPIYVTINYIGEEDAFAKNRILFAEVRRCVFRLLGQPKAAIFPTL